MATSTLDVIEEVVVRRILLVLNRPNREMSTISSIKREILVQSPNTEVQIIPYDHMFASAVKKFRPDVILTFPMGSAGVARSFYLFKLYYCMRVLCFRSEGILDPNVPANVAGHIGFDRYGSRLIDAE